MMRVSWKKESPDFSCSMINNNRDDLASYPRKTSFKTAKNKRIKTFLKIWKKKSKFKEKIFLWQYDVNMNTKIAFINNFPVKN